MDDEPILSNLSRERWKKIFEKERAKNEQELERLKRECKPLDELVVLGYFGVDDVVCTSDSTYVRNGPIIIGGSNPVSSTGYSVQNLLQVHQFRGGGENVGAVKEIVFNGFSAVRTGDVIKALIPRYIEIRNPIARLFDYPSSLPAERYYLDREFEKREIAIQISIHDDSDNFQRSTRIERSVDYYDFFSRRN